MDRREFLSRAVPAVAVFGIGSQPRSAFSADTAQANDWRSFEITTSIHVANPAGRTRLWLPLPWSEATPYQRLLDARWDAPNSSHAEVVSAGGYDVSMLHVEWPDEKSVGEATLTQRVALRDRRVDLSRATSGAGPAETRASLAKYLRPTALLPTDGVVKETADKVTRGAHGDIERARSIYEWVVDNTSRDPKTAGCGMGDVGSMLRSGHLSGKCADINGLFVALARASGIPARDAYGIRVAESRLGYQCLGRNGDISKSQHCRAEFYAQNHGWIPVDPADVRKVVLEESPGGLALDNPKVQSVRKALFGGWEMNWVAYNHGHDVDLPGSNGAAIPFLMYPNGETADGRLNSIDPATFRYEIHSRELSA
jgi:transglutaminase-like putative cysteine protease